MRFTSYCLTLMWKHHFVFLVTGLNWMVVIRLMVCLLLSLLGNIILACVASVSSGQEANSFCGLARIGRAQKKKKTLEGVGEKRRRKRLPTNPSILKTTYLQSRQSCHILTNGREAHESPVQRLFTLLSNTMRDSLGFFHNTSL